VEEAAGGTLFLDEVGDLSLEAQAKLLRFLEEGEYYRVGATHKQRVKTRVISATNRDIEQMIEDDRFRRDLYYRLAVIKVDVPRLSTRPEDILPIARHFMIGFSAKFGKEFNGITAQAEQALLNRDWKGNVRELRNVIERAVLTGRGPLLAVDDILPETAQTKMQSAGPAPVSGAQTLTASGIDLPATLKAIEKNYFDEALRLSGGKESEAARLLNLNYYTFRHRRKKLYEE
jgi:DNA-binding NtrC family response regulator